jgi:hypothetical protein
MRRRELNTETDLLRHGLTILRAKKRHMHRSKQNHYSITSSAVASSDGGTVTPSIRAI